MKSRKLIDVAKDPNDPLTQEAMNTFKSKEGDTIVCRHCGNNYTRGVFNFYDLCNSCMEILNRAKRIAMWRYVKNQQRDGNNS